MVKIVLWFIVALHTAAFLSGCSATTFLGGASHSKPVIVLNVPPNRIGYGGHLNKEDRALILDMTKEMLKHPYKEFHYPYSSGVSSLNENRSSTSHSYSGTTAIQAQVKGKIK